MAPSDDRDEGGYAAHLVEQALGDEEPASATVLRVSGHWQQLTSIGNALSSCCLLTDVDLSRNGLSTLNGLQMLSQLRKLNMYYNAITDLSELMRLRDHGELTVLDLRLNPVRGARRSPRFS